MLHHTSNSDSRRGRLLAALVFLSLSSGTSRGATEASVQHLDSFVVTGTRTPYRVSEAPIRTELVMSSEMELAGARSLADSVELLPGVRIENNCQNCGTSDILLLGLEGKYTAVLFDGLPLYSGLASVYGLDQIPAAFIERIEVVKGGGSAVYGSGAVGGVVNIIAREPSRSGGLFEFRHDSAKGRPSNQITGLADHVSEDGEFAATVYGQTTRTSAVDLNGDGFSDLTKRDLQVLGLRARRTFRSGTLGFDYSRTTEFRRGGNKSELPDNLADISERVDTSRDAGSVRWSATVSPSFDYQVSGGFAYIDRSTFYGGLFGHAANEALAPESSPGSGDNDQAFLDRGYKTYGEVAQDEFGYTKNWVGNLEAQFNRRWGAHQSSVGIQYYREKIDDIVPVSSFVTGYPVAADVATGDNLGLFAQDDWHASHAWEFVLGLRADKNSELDDVVLSPRLNVKHTPNEHLTLRASFGTGFRAPQPFDEDLHIELVAGNRAKTVQAADLKQEKSYSALLGATWNPSFAEGKMTLEANGFYTRLHGTFTNSEIMNDPDSGESYRLRYNGPGAEVGGVEFNLGTLPLPKLRVDAGYVLQFARYKEAVPLYQDEQGNVLSERDFLETPSHYAVVQGTYTGELATLALSAVYTGSMKDVNLRTGQLNRRTRDFLVWNATVSRAFSLDRGATRFTVTAGVKNLFDSRQKDLEAGVDRDPYYLYGPRTPRTFFASVRVEF